MEYIETIKEACQKAGVKVETHQKEYYTLVGFQVKQWIWHWFRVYDSYTYMLFDHTYSQNTGRSKRGVCHMLKVQDSIRRRTGLQI